MPGLSFFPGGSTLQIPLEAPTALTATAGNAKVSLTWTDPVDKYATPEGEQAQDPQQLVSVWAYTKIVRKAGSAPTGPNDGVTVMSSEVRNAYQTEPFVDTGLTNNTTYYYGAFAYNEDGVVSEGAITSCHLFGFDAVLENNTWGQIDQAGAIGLAPSLWEIGDEKNFTVGSEMLTSVILDFNHDNASDGSGKVPISFGLKELMSQTRGWNWMASNRANGYLDSGFPTYFEGTVIPNLPVELQNVLKTVNKTFEASTTTKMALPTLVEINGTGVMDNSSDRPTGGRTSVSIFCNN